MTEFTRPNRAPAHPLTLFPPAEPKRPGGLLPSPLSSFVGRREEVTTVTSLLGEKGIRLVTLTGPGGVGKTRLALRVGEASSFEFLDGVAFVSLAEVADGTLVLPTIAQAIDVPVALDQPLVERLVAELTPRHLLLILDNFEHLLSAAPQVGDLLTSCPRLAVLATSREPLRLTGEHTVTVETLAVPKVDASAKVVASADAVRLFANRAHAVRTGISLTDENVHDVAAICRRVDGLPLAIELAAARVAHLPLAAILDRLEQRLPMLTGGPRDLPERQRTMTATIAWSHDLLTQREQVLFRRLAVFEGGCTLDAATVVLAGVPGCDILEELASLVAKSLVQMEASVDGEGRYRMLETIREFAHARLTDAGDEEVTRAAVTDYFLAVAERLRPRIEGADGVPALQRLELEHPNLRMALTYAIGTGGSETALRLSGALWKFWWVHRHVAAGRQWLERALELESPVPPRVRLEALYGAGALALGHSDDASAAKHGTEGLALAREIGDCLHEARFRYLLGSAAVDSGDLDQAAMHFNAALAGFRSCEGHAEPSSAAFAHHGAAMALVGAAAVAIAQGQLEPASALSAEALAIWRGRGDRWGMAEALGRLAEAQAAQGQVESAVVLYRESLEHYAASGDSAGVAECVSGLAGVAASCGQTERAARLLGAAEGLRTTSGAVFRPTFRLTHERTVSMVQATLSKPDFAAAWAGGRRLERDEAVAEALAESHWSDLTAREVPHSHGADALTRREEEVLRLLVEGKTDREVAETLFVSRRTVTSHVSTILGKLGVNTRTATATTAVRRGLV